MAPRKKSNKSRPVSTLPSNTLEMQRFFMVRSDISKLIWNDPTNLQILDLLEELMLMSKMSDWPLLRNAALKALASAQLAPLVPILQEDAQVRILGVDPGCYGALALLDGHWLGAVVDMPFLKVRRGKSDKAEIDGYMLGDLLRTYKSDVVVVEAVGGMTGQSASAAFNFGRAAGAPEYAAKALGLRVERVHPATWKKALKINPGKDGSRDAAMRLFPHRAEDFSRKKDDGRAEAALIAHWFSLQQRGVENGVFA